MAPTAASQSSGQPNALVSYKHCFGVPAPKATLKKNLVPPKTNTTMRKAIPRSSTIWKGGSLAFINSGWEMVQGSMRFLIIIVIIYLLIRGFSGAATVSMEGQLFCAQNVILFQFVRNALISEAKKTCFDAHLVS